MTTSHGPGQGPHVTGIRFEHHDEPFGIGEAEPRLSWRVVGTATEWWQAGYELALFDDQGNELTTTGMVHSDEQILVPWPFPPLTSRQRAGVCRCSGAKRRFVQVLDPLIHDLQAGHP